MKPHRLLALLSVLAPIFVAPVASRAQELERLACVAHPGAACPERICIIPDSFVGLTRMNTHIEEGRKLWTAAHQTSDSSEKRTRLKAAQAAFLAAEESIGSHCNPAIALDLGRIAGALGEIEAAAAHLEPLLCTFVYEINESPECEIKDAPNVREGRELLSQLTSSNFLLDVTPSHATARLTSKAHVDVPLPASISDLGWRRLPPGEYILTLSAPQHHDLSVPLDLRAGARFKQPLVLERACAPSTVHVDDANSCPPSSHAFTPSVGVLLSARGLLRDVPSGGATNLLATLLLHPQLALEAGAELAPNSVGGRAGVSVPFGQEWFASLQAGGSVLAPTGDAARLGAKTLGGMHLGLRSGYSEPRWAAFVDLTAEYFPKAGAPAALLAGGGVQWRFWALE